jgi:hypothetical protein
VNGGALIELRVFMQSAFFALHARSDYLIILKYFLSPPLHAPTRIRRSFLTIDLLMSSYDDKTVNSTYRSNLLLWGKRQVEVSKPLLVFDDLLQFLN